MVDADFKDDLKVLLALVDKTFGINKVLADEGRDLIADYYTQSGPAYEAAYSSEGCMHLALNPDGEFSRDGYRSQPRAIVREMEKIGGSRVLELGCGTGAAFLCLAARVPRLGILAVDRDPVLVDIAQRNAGLNLLPAEIRAADARELRHLPPIHHAFANPPYWAGGTPSPMAGRRQAAHEDAPLADWVQAMARPLRHKGTLSLVLPAARFAEAAAALIEAASTRYAWLTINMNAEPLKDIRVRQAIQYAYDGDAVLAGAYDGLVARSTGVVPPTSGFARPANLIATRDVEKAKALLAEAGAEGLTLNLYALTDSTTQTIAQIIQANLAEAGITVEIQPVDDAAYWALGDKTAGEDYKSIELVLMNFAGGIDPTENLVWFRPEQIGVYNWSFFDSAEFETLFQSSMTEADAEKRRTMFNRMEDLMEESGGFIFICFEPYLAIHDSNLVPVILADGHPDPVAFTKA
ncbi:MAG: hypothetical protein RLZZ563_1509 [Pseudomonadota bacterium]